MVRTQSSSSVSCASIRDLERLAADLLAWDWLACEHPKNSERNCNNIKEKDNPTHIIIFLVFYQTGIIFLHAHILQLCKVSSISFDLFRSYTYKKYWQIDGQTGLFLYTCTHKNLCLWGMTSDKAPINHITLRSHVRQFNKSLLSKISISNQLKRCYMVR